MAANSGDSAKQRTHLGSGDQGVARSVQALGAWFPVGFVEPAPDDADPQHGFLHHDAGGHTFLSDFSNQHALALDILFSVRFLRDGFAGGQR